MRTFDEQLLQARQASEVQLSNPPASAGTNRQSKNFAQISKLLILLKFFFEICNSANITKKRL